MSNQIPASTMKELRSVLMRWVVVLAVVGAFATWATWRMASAANRTSEQRRTANAAEAEPAIEYWTCTTHPQIREPAPGDCPICGMKLLPKYAGSDEPGAKPAAGAPTREMHDHTAMSMAAGGQAKAWYRCTMPECGDVGSADSGSRCPVCGMKRERVDLGAADAGDFEIRLNERAQRLAEVATEVVAPRLLFKRIRTVGRVGYDETRFKMVSAWIAGRIDKLFADFTGMTVAKGDHLVEIYSPELLSAQEEFLQTLRTARGPTGAMSDVARRSNDQILKSARRKLELLGVTDAQLAAIERSDQPQTHLVIYAPIGGTVVDKRVMEGMYVKTGDPLYSIADLTQLWLLVDLYEADLPWIKPFQQVRLTTRSLPGETFDGEIFFVDPRVDPKTRTVAVRIHVENPDMQLKPDMWVTAEIRSALGPGGRGAVPAPGGKYACPMHPWITSDSPGTCGLCEMNLVAVQDLPQYAPPTDSTPILAVPRSAVMQTGERAIAYVETAPGTYRGTEIEIGPLAEDVSGEEFYPVLSGLHAGEHVVTRGNFAIDSQAQLAGKHSLFSGGGSMQGHAHESSPSPALQAATGKMQTTCPVMDEEINPDVYTDAYGVRIYFCCEPCIDTFAEAPEKYVANLPEAIRAKVKLPAAKGGSDD